MALIANQAQCSYAAFSPRLVPKNKPLKLQAFAPYRPIGRTNKSILLNKWFSLSGRRQFILSLKKRSCKISSFKGNAHNDESENRTSNSKFSKSSVQLSYAEKEEREESVTDPSEAQKRPLAYVSEEREVVAPSPVIQLFKKWLVMLRTQTSSQPSEDIFKERLSQADISLHHHETSQQGAAGQLIKASWGYYLGLDVAIKIPPLIFIPLYLAVNIIYGAQVAKELKPLWILGPMIVALYIKILQVLCSLYILSFKKTMKVVRNLPTYYNYVAEGRLHQLLRARLLQPVLDVKNLDYKELSKKKLRELEEWAGEKYLDFIECIWPYYCRTIRFLKKANFI